MAENDLTDALTPPKKPAAALPNSTAPQGDASAYDAVMSGPTGGADLYNPGGGVQAAPSGGMANSPVKDGVMLDGNPNAAPGDVEPKGELPVRMGNAGAATLGDPNAPPADMGTLPGAATPADMSPADAAKAGLGWVDKNNPNYGKPGYVGSTPGTVSAAPGATPYGAPGAAPGVPSADTQVQNKLLDQMNQGLTPDANDPVIKGQLDAFSAARQRAERNQVADSAESLGPQATGAQAGAARMAHEKSAQDQSAMAADLVGREQMNRRDEIKNALAQLGATGDADKKNALQLELGKLDASIKQQGLEQTGQIGNRELDIRNALGQGGLNNDLMSMLLNNKNTNNRLGFDVGSKQSDIDMQTMRTAMGL